MKHKGKSKLIFPLQYGFGNIIKKPLSFRYCHSSPTSAAVLRPSLFLAAPHSYFSSKLRCHWKLSVYMFLTMPLKMPFQSNFCSCALPLTPPKRGCSHRVKVVIKAVAERSGRVLLPVFATSAACNQDTRCLQASTAGGMGKKVNPACVIACICTRKDVKKSLTWKRWKC